MDMEERMSLCRSAMEETLNQIKTLQSKHQQLIGYYQALQDISQELPIEKEEPVKKPTKSKAAAA
jgi:hypothetical protein